MRLPYQPASRTRTLSSLPFSLSPDAWDPLLLGGWWMMTNTNAPSAWLPLSDMM